MNLNFRILHACFPYELICVCVQSRIQVKGDEERSSKEHVLGRTFRSESQYKGQRNFHVPTTFRDQGESRDLFIYSHFQVDLIYTNICNIFNLVALEKCCLLCLRRKATRFPTGGRYTPFGMHSSPIGFSVF